LVVAVIFDVVVSLCGCLGSAVLAAATAGLGSIITVCVPFLGVVPWAVSIYYGIQAYQGKYVEIPYLTDFMVKQGWLEKH
jgi:hypothetical protein